MNKTPVRISISLTTMLWTVALASAFLAGWVLPSPLRKTHLTPAVIATSELLESSQAFSTSISASDVEVVTRPSDSVPDNAATRIEQVEGATLLRPIHKGGYIFIDDLHKLSPSIIGCITVPPGMKVVNIKIPWQPNEVLLNFLDPRDRVSIDYVLKERDPETDNKVINVSNDAWIFNLGRKPLPNNPSFALLGVMVDEEDFARIVNARKSKGKFRIGVRR